MTDRTPTKILSNGAIRYGVYDDAGALLRYEYIKPEDEPTQAGDALNKANLLPDGVAAALGLSGNPQVKDALLLIDTVRTLANGRAQIATGSYTGTGTYGASNKNSLVIDGATKLVFIMGYSNSRYYLGIINTNYETGLVYILDAGGQAVAGRIVSISFSSGTLTWYNTVGTEYQLNYSGATYRYVTIG